MIQNMNLHRTKQEAFYGAWMIGEPGIEVLTKAKEKAYELIKEIKN